MSEITLRQDVLDELEFEPSVNAAHIGVAINDGAVALTGMGKLRGEAGSIGCCAARQRCSRHRR